MIYRNIKSTLDVVLAVILAPIVLIISIFIAILIKLDSKGPVFFKCNRLGKNGIPIKILKFRTMYHGSEEIFNSDGSRFVEKNDNRITRVGYFLRHGLDEIPQILNIIRGEVSFIGPRPDDLFALDLYQERDFVKLLVRPGLTGLSQVSGRNEIPYADRLKYDVYYSENFNFILDVRIFISTFFIITGFSNKISIIEFRIIDENYKRLCTVP